MRIDSEFYLIEAGSHCGKASNCILLRLVHTVERLVRIDSELHHIEASSHCRKVSLNRQRIVSY